MPSFKEKTEKKKKIEKVNINIDSRHSYIMNEFENNEENIIPDLKIKKKKLKHLLSKTENNDEKQQIQNRILQVKTEIKNLNNQKQDYLLNNSKYIFEYFENKKNISNDENTTNNNDKVNNFFKITKKHDAILSKFQLEANINSNINKYLRNNDKHFLDINSFTYPNDICSECFKGELVSIEDEGVFLCLECFRTFRCLIENEKPSYKEPPKEVCFYAYRKINHLKEVLSQLQGKETTNIPDAVIINIKLQMKKERLTNKDMTNLKTKAILKKLNYNTYYEHIPFIKNKLGIPPPIMTPELEDIICILFIELQAPYILNCPDDKTNFLNYYYTVYKLCELLKQRQYLEFLQLLNDNVKINEQDAIWKKICKHLDWLYIPTVVK